MKISELPQDLKEKALDYQRNETDFGYDKQTDSLVYAFDWEDTKEGFSFWEELHYKQPTHYDNSFDKIIEDTLSRVRELLVVKGKEYRRNNDPFHNFNEGAKITGLSPERVLDGFLLKHEISIKDMVNDLDFGIMPTLEKVNEKLDDNIIYLLIKKAMLIQRIKDESNISN